MKGSASYRVFGTQTLGQPAFTPHTDGLRLLGPNLTTHKATSWSNRADLGLLFPVWLPYMATGQFHTTLGGFVSCASLSEGQRCKLFNILDGGFLPP